jgi:hypothetical protein
MGARELRRRLERLEGEPPEDLHDLRTALVRAWVFRARERGTPAPVSRATLRAAERDGRLLSPGLSLLPPQRRTGPDATPDDWAAFLRAYGVAPALMSEAEAEGPEAVKALLQDLGRVELAVLVMHGPEDEGAEQWAQRMPACVGSELALLSEDRFLGLYLHEEGRESSCLDFLWYGVRYDLLELLHREWEQTGGCRATQPQILALKPEPPAPCPCGGSRCKAGPCYRHRAWRALIQAVRPENGRPS